MSDVIVSRYVRTLKEAGITLHEYRGAGYDCITAYLEKGEVRFYDYYHYRPERGVQYIVCLDDILPHDVTLRSPPATPEQLVPRIVDYLHRVRIAEADAHKWRKVELLWRMGI